MIFRNCRKLAFIVFLVLFLNLLFAEKLLTVAESSNYTRTAQYCEVMDFISKLQKRSRHLRLEIIAESIEGRDVPMLILGDPLPGSYADMRYDDRLVVYIQANIHAGEIEGKAAALMLARDILLGRRREFLNNMVILIAPIFNPDGNEKFSKDNRQSQNGPEKVGVRYNGQMLDLNRDAIKVESPEMQGLLKNVLNTWDPALVIDCHTTNGSKHKEPVTFVWGNNPNGDKRLIDFMWSEFRPFLKNNMRNKFAIESVEYGHFMDYKNPEKGWKSVGPEARYLVNYISLRNRLSLLNENYSYADYKTRVRGAYAFLNSSLTFCHNNKNEIREILKQADQETIQKGLTPSKADSFIVDYKQVPYQNEITLRGYEMEVTPRENSSWPKVEYFLDQPRQYKMPYYGKFESERSVPYPVGYFIDCQAPEIINNLQNHGILVEKLTESITVPVTEFELTGLKARERLFQGHYLTSIEGQYQAVNKKFKAGTYFVPTGQKLGSLAAYLLEPESKDGLLAWNFFDRYLVKQWRGLGHYPVYKLHQQINMAKSEVIH